MSKFTDLQNAKAKANATQDRRLKDASRFGTDFIKVAVESWEVPNDTVFFLKTFNSIPIEDGRIKQESDYLTSSGNQITTWLLVSME